MADSSCETKFGVRKIVFDANVGLILNDRKVKVQGTCNHHDFAGVGAALPDNVNRFRVAALQEFGVNGWRMSHNPPAPELPDMTDQMGMLVWDEIRHLGDFELWRGEARDTILRDRNHPSVIMYVPLVQRVGLRASRPGRRRQSHHRCRCRLPRHHQSEVRQQRSVGR